MTAPSGDLSATAVAVACALCLASVVLLLVELVRARRPRSVAVAIGSSGAAAAIGLLVAVLRPVVIHARGSLIGPRVVVLVDSSRSIDLPGAGGTRRQTLEQAASALGKRSGDVRFSWLAFGEGPPTPLPQAPAPGSLRPAPRSDLGAALDAVARAADERPAAIVVLSDGRLDRPSAAGAGAETRDALAGLGVPVHTVALATEAPRDASIRKVDLAGAAVAHRELSLRIEIGCEGGLSCDELHTTVHELREKGAPTQLAAGTANASGGSATIELGVVLDRAGTRILEIATDVPSGDTVPENNKRLVAVDVARERVRVLHVAGRPTYDVRALRMWLKSDASLDVIAFFILRTHSDDVVATQDELALIPFPVDELFQKHLPSFDAVVLQDFDALPYGLSKYLGDIARYVDKGGGLIMVGGPDAFGPGHYAGTEIERVLPVSLPAEAGVDQGAFVPRVTEAGRVAPVLAPTRGLVGDELPEMPGTNIVGDAKPGATVLLEHPTRKTESGAAMPVLALGEVGSGRTMALSIDGSHRLLFSAFAATAAGRAHGAFWDAMLGWLMRDPRFEPAVVDVPGGCIAGEPTTLSLKPLPGLKGDATLTVARLGTGDVAFQKVVPIGGPEGAAVDVGRLDAGGYTASVEIATATGRAPPTRRDFACEKGGDEWADTRPDVDRLRAIADATGGRAVNADGAASLPLPPATLVASERNVAPVLPPWAWATLAALLLGAHWVVRRKSGLT